MTTAADLMDLALRDSGAFGTGQTPTDQDNADALFRFNMMLGQWNRRRWLVYHLVDTACAVTGLQTYSIGPGGNFNIARPDRIEAAYIRQLFPNAVSPVDWSLTEITSYEDYSQIALKSLKTAPSGLFFYDSGYPFGTLYPWPIPQGGYELHILTKAVLAAIVDPTVPLVLPPEYEQAIYANLVIMYRSAYRLPVDSFLVGQARATLNTIRRANFQIGRLSLPIPVTRNDWYTGYLFGGGGGGQGTDVLVTEDGETITTEDGQAIAV